MASTSKIDSYIKSNPQRSWKLGILTLCFFFQLILIPAVWLTYYLFRNCLKVKLSNFVLGSFTIFLIELFCKSYSNSLFNIIFMIKNAFHVNGSIINCIIQGDLYTAFSIICEYFDYLFFFAPFVVGILGIIDFIPENPHMTALKALQQGQHNNSSEISQKDFISLLESVKENIEEGILLGVSKMTGKPVFVTDEIVNQIILVLGTTGGGKTVTLRRFNRYAIQRGYPLIIVDAKPSKSNIEYLKNLAEEYDRPFLGFNCDKNLTYDCLSNGGYTENKDKIISLKDKWDSDYYLTIAESYLQTVFAVLIDANEKLNLRRVSECLDYDELAMVVRSSKNKDLQNRVASLNAYERKDIQGLQAHLNLLIHSELGEFFENQADSINLSDAVDNNAVVYFALPALRFPSFSKVLGKLVINDIKTVIARAETTKPIYCIFDEFSVFAGPQVTNLVNMGRERGLHTIFGTQGTADLEEVSETFSNQILNCVNTIICHRLNDHKSAETICIWGGTKDVFSVTAQLDIKNIAGLGSVRSTKEFVIHPDQIKQSLQKGDAFFLTKVGKFNMDKIKVKFS